MRQALQRAWLSRGLVARLLWPASVLYGALAGVHRGAYRLGLRRAASAGVPVVVVGNVVAGGAGKTPVVMAIAEHFTAQGVSVGVVSRGHGRSSTGTVRARADSDPAEAGDEPLLIARRTGLPVYVGERRIGAAKALRAAAPRVQLIVCDDGLQHHGLARDVDVCVFDDRGIGNGWLLPAGPLREPWPRPVDLVLRTAAVTGIPGHLLRRSLATHGVRADGSRVALSTLHGGACHAVAGIAQPEPFFAMLRAAGLHLLSTLALPDHADFTTAPLPADGAPLLCTEKDAVKLWQRVPHAVAIPLDVQIEPAFWQALDALVLPKLSFADGPQTP
jgi:tetraacyldisaccharide 4'-kinase